MTSQIPPRDHPDWQQAIAAYQRFFQNAPEAAAREEIEDEEFLLMTLARPLETKDQLHERAKRLAMELEAIAASPKSLLAKAAAKTRRIIELWCQGARMELQPTPGAGPAEPLPRRVSLPESWFGRPIALRAEKLEFADTGRPTCWRIYPEEAGITLRLRLVFETHEKVVQISLAHELLIGDDDVAILVAIEIIVVLP